MLYKNKSTSLIVLGSHEDLLVVSQDGRWHCGGGGCATRSDHMTRQEASDQEGASLAHKNLLSIPQELLWLENKG